LELEPNEPGKGFEFISKIVGGSVPKEYVKPTAQGIEDTLTNGVLAGFPVVDVNVTVYDGSYRGVDSNEMSFKLAASLSMRECMPKCNPVLLEPVQRVEITVPFPPHTATSFNCGSGR